MVEMIDGVGYIGGPSIGALFYMVSCERNMSNVSGSIKVSSVVKVKVYFRLDSS